MSNVKAFDSAGRDIEKLQGNQGYAYVYGWAALLDSMLEHNTKNADALIKEQVGSLYSWFDDKDENIQNGGMDALTTLEQSDWQWASKVMDAELSIMCDLEIPIERDFF